MGVQTAISNLSTAPTQWHKFDGSGSGQTNAGSAGGTWSASGTFTWSQTGSNAVDSNAAYSTTGYISKTFTKIASSTYTHAFWMKRSSAPSSNSILINMTYDSTHNYDSYDECGLGTDGKIKWGPRHGAAATAVVTGSSVCDGNWHFIVLQRDSTTLRMYVDGVSQGTGTCGSSNNANLSSTVYFGPADGGAHYLDEYFFADYVLTSTQISSIWDASPFAAVNVTVTDTAGMATATPHAVFADPAFSNVTNVAYSDAGTMDASNADFADPIIGTISNINIAEGPMTADGTFANATIIGDSTFSSGPSTATIEFSLTDPVIYTEQNASVAADPMTTSSVTMPGGSRYLRTYTLNLTDDKYWYASGPSYDNGSAGYLSLREHTNGQQSVIFATLDTFNSQLGNGNNVTEATFTYKMYASVGDLDTRDIDVYRLTKSYASYTASPYTDLTLVSTATGVVIPDNAGDSFSFDVKEILKGYLAGTYTNYGIAWALTDGTNSVNNYVYGYSTANSADRPYITITADIGLDDAVLQVNAHTASADMADPNIALGSGYTESALPAEISDSAIVDPILTLGTGFTHDEHGLEASVDMVDPSIDATDTVSYSATVATAEAVLEDPSTETTQDAGNIEVGSLNASSLMNDGTVIGDSLYQANEINGNSLDIVDPTITVELNAGTVFPEVMTVSAVFPNAAYNRAIDPYYSRIKTIAGNANELYIFDGLDSDTYGKKPLLNPSQSLGNEAGVYGVNYGEVIAAPGSRKATQLVDSGIIYQRNLTSTSSIGGTDSAFEMVLRTNTADAGQIYEYKVISGLGGLSEIKGFIRGGKLVFERYSYASGRAILSGITTGFKNIADGQWHHIVVNFNDDIVTPETYYDAYIDGVRDHKRYVNMASATRADRTAIVANLTADVMSVAYYSLQLTADQIVKNYYLALDIYVIEVDPMIASIAAVNPSRVRGNQTRVIMLYFRDVVADVDLKDSGGNTGSYLYPEWETYDFGPQISTTESSLWNGADIFPYPIIGPWRDEVTDELRSINLLTDLNLQDFDMITFRNYPNESSEFDFITGQTQPVPYRDVWTKEREIFCANLITAINTYGTSLYVNDPQLAIDLGIVDKVTSDFDLHDLTPGADNGNAAGAGDPRSKIVDPFQGDASINAAFAVEEEYFSDTHTLARHRIVNNVNGITSNLSNKYVITDWTRYIPYDPFKIDQFSYKYETGAIDKDFYIPMVGDAGIYGGQFYDFGASGAGRRAKIISTPAANVKYGTILTAISPTYYEGSTLKANPLAGNATSIVVQPGQNLKNVQMNAKIYVNFTEPMAYCAWSDGLQAQDETKPLNPNLNASEINFMWNNNNRSWQYSTWRISATYTSLRGAIGQEYQKTAQESKIAGFIKQTVVKSERARISSDGAYRIVGAKVSDLPVLNLTQNYENKMLDAWVSSNAGWNWLSEPVIINDEDAINRPSALQAVAEIKEPIISSDQSVEVFSEALVAVATIRQPEEYDLPDFEILTVRMIAEAVIIPSVLRMLAEPMTASASTSLLEPAITTTGEEVVLTLHHSDAVLYIKEKI